MNELLIFSVQKPATYRETQNMPKDLKKLVILTRARQIQKQMRNKVIYLSV